MTIEAVAALALLLAWLAWPRALGRLWRSGRITPGLTTALLIARTPAIVGLGAMIFGASPLVVVLVVVLTTAAGAILFRYLREFLSDPRTT